METMTETTSVEKEIAIAASPEAVWQFLVYPDKVTRWMGQAATIDPRPGGVYRVEVCPGNTAHREVVELDPPRRLVYTWGWEPDGKSSVPVGSTTVEIELVATDDGTMLRLSHRGLPNAEDAQSHAHGWDHYVGRLAVVASGGDPGPDPWATGDV